MKELEALIEKLESLRSEAKLASKSGKGSAARCFSLEEVLALPELSRLNARVWELEKLRPMEDAPRDGEEILVWINTDLDGDKQNFAFWRLVFLDYQGDLWPPESDCPLPVEYLPLGWLPLPSLPEIPAQEGK